MTSASGAKNTLAKDVPAKSGAEASDEGILKKDLAAAEAPDDQADDTVDSDLAKATFAAHEPSPNAVFWSKLARPSDPPTAPIGAIEGEIKKDISAAKSGAEASFDAETCVIKNDPALKPVTKVATALKPAAPGGAPLSTINDFPEETPAPGDADWTVLNSRNKTERKGEVKSTKVFNKYDLLDDAETNAEIEAYDEEEDEKAKEKGKEASTGCVSEPSNSAPSGDTNYFSWPCFACPSGFFVLVSAISALFFEAFRRFASMGKPAIKKSSQGASSAGPCRTTIFGLVAVIGMCGIGGFASMLPNTIALPLPAAALPTVTIADDVMHSQDAFPASFRTAYYAASAHTGCMLETWKNATPGADKIMVFTHGKPCPTSALCPLWDDMTATCSASEIPLGTKYLVQLGDQEEQLTLGCSAPVFTKNRLISRKRGIVLPLEWERHLGEVVNEAVRLSAAMPPWREKKAALVWRGSTTGRRRRYVHALSEAFFNVRFTQVVQGKDSWISKPEHKGERMTQRETLQYRYVLSLEGNSYATNLAWQLASSSLVVMPVPRWETWLMEGLLIPFVHYVPLEDPSKWDTLMKWLEAHPQLCQTIIKNANRWVKRVRGGNITHGLTDSRGIQPHARWLLQQYHL